MAVASGYLFKIIGEAGAPLDATVDLETGAITMLSRGGTRGTSSASNLDYAVALRIMLRRLLASRRTIKGAWVDSNKVQSIPLSERQILSEADLPANAETIFSLLGKRMERIGKAPDSDPEKGNRNKRIRIELCGGSIGEIASTIGAKPGSDVPRHVVRLPADDLYKVTELSIWSAVEALLGGAPAPTFEQSEKYDLLTPDGERLAPKAVFGLAAGSALGFQVQSQNFTGGTGTHCFEILQKAGWQIVSKGNPIPAFADEHSLDDREWVEGDKRRAEHLRRERCPSLAKAKKADQRAKYGKLFCERCLMEPLEIYGELDGEACIEVHHETTPVAEMRPGHRTKLEDVRCLCANCHRFAHRLMKRRQAEDTKTLLSIGRVRDFS